MENQRNNPSALAATVPARTLLQTKNRKGFTLVELMIVVAIVGILSAVAVPNYLKYQAKARQAEAKIGLASIYTAEKSAYAEYASYHTCTGHIGYVPDGTSRFYGLGFHTVLGATGLPTCSAVGSTNNVATTNFDNETCWTATNRVNGSVSLTTTTDMCNNSAIATDSFTAAARGNITRQTSAQSDVWTINDNKFINNFASGI